MNYDTPSLDAAAHYEARDDAQREDDRAWAEAARAMSATRAALPKQLSEREALIVIQLLVHRIDRGDWSHKPHAKDAVESLVGANLAIETYLEQEQS